jgi:hypothetical protein
VLSHENRQALADMHDTALPDDLMVPDDTQGVDGNSGRDWEPVGDFLDNDEAFTEAMCQAFEHRYVSCIIPSHPLNSFSFYVVMLDLEFTETQGLGDSAWSDSNRTGWLSSHP